METDWLDGGAAIGATVFADPGDIADPAEVEHGQGMGLICRHGHVKERHEGRALAASRHVFAPEIVDDVDAGQGCEQATVADLIPSSRR